MGGWGNTAFTTQVLAVVLMAIILWAGVVQVTSSSSSKGSSSSGGQTGAPPPASSASDVAWPAKPSASASSGESVPPLFDLVQQRVTGNIAIMHNKASQPDRQAEGRPACRHQ